MYSRIGKLLDMRCIVLKKPAIGMHVVNEMLDKQNIQNENRDIGKCILVARIDG